MEYSVRYRRRNLTGSGVELALHCWGDPGAGQPLLFLHGFGQTARAWEASARRIAGAGHFCAALDARGHGDSDWCAAANYAIDYFEQDLHTVLAQLPPRPLLVGASMGGLLAMGCEAAQPGLFSAMVLVDITPRWDPRGVQRIFDFMSAKPEGFADLEEAAATIATYLPHRAQRSAASFDGLRKNLRLGDDGRYRWHWDPQLLTQMKQLGTAKQPRLLEAASQLTLPVRLISGGRSDLTSQQTIAEFQQLVPHAEHVRIDDAHHMVAGDSNDCFSSAVIEFLTAQPTAADSSTTPFIGDTPCQQSA